MKGELAEAVSEVATLRAELAAAQAETKSMRPVVEGEVELESDFSSAAEEERYKKDLAEKLGVKWTDIDLERS